MNKNNNELALKVHNAFFPSLPDEQANLITAIVVEESSRGWKSLPSPYAFCVELVPQDSRNSNNIKSALTASILRETGRDGFVVLELEVSSVGKLEYAATKWRLYIVLNASSAEFAKRTLSYIFDGWLELGRPITKYKILTEGRSLRDPVEARRAIIEAEKYVARQNTRNKGVKLVYLRSRGLKVHERTKHTKKNKKFSFDRKSDPLRFIEFVLSEKNDEMGADIMATH